ncbi:macro domain-like protein [Sistotremastrum niveocremeum HHB9708]|uniref:Macro domain-like protein n=1 Tax=Sistotremastrum niveocremeum HHB9708 TaxID=1314777 RepID=A0A164TZN3_9AGAM|nr:macro domain-like protein [Sistotremastrum niveocremeum HHB9708]
MSPCRTLRGCETGDAKITKGYRLPAKHVIHTVGPIYAKSQDDECARLLASCYDKCLQLAVGLDLATIAFPSISMGVYGYPPKDGAKIALSTIRNYLELNPGKLSQVILVVFSSEMMDVYLAQISEIFPPDVDCELDSVGLQSK